MKYDPRVAFVIEAMQRRMGEQIRIPDFARTVNLSPSRFAHLFREQTGCSPGAYLRDFRLDRARLLLETTSRSVRDIMVEVGFRDPSHFSRDFQKAFGASPRDWRKGAAPTEPPVGAGPGAPRSTADVVADASGRGRRDEEG
jgi:AraC family transcriptional regulator of arabinose operon